MKRANLLYHTVSIIRKIILVITLFLIFNGFGIFSGDGARALFMYSNLTNFLFWVIFLMGSIVLVFLGRVFCAICPVGELNYLISKIGLKKKINLELSFLQAISLFVVFLSVIIFNVSKHPHLTSLLILLALILSALFGLIFKGNSFCLLLCPANAFLKFYGIFSSIKIRGKEGCSASCPLLLNPCNLKKEECHLCLRCFKDTNALSLSMENPFKNIKLPHFNKNDFFIFSVLTGISYMAFIRVVREVRELFVYIPFKITEILSLSYSFILPLTTLFGVFLYPTLFFTITALFIKIFSSKSFKDVMEKYTPYFIFSTLSVHLILALVKLNSRIGFLPFALLDPSGKDVVTLRLSYNFDIPGDIIPIQYFRFILLAIPAFFFVIGLSKIIKLERGSAIPLSIFFSLAFIFIEKIIIMWLLKAI